MPCAHEKSVPAGPVVIYDGTGGEDQPDTVGERIDYAQMWARAHGRKVLADLAEAGPSAKGVDLGDGLVFAQFEGAATLLELYSEAWLLVVRPETLHPDAGIRRQLANRVGGRVVCANGGHVPHDHPEPTADDPAAYGPSGDKPGGYDPADGDTIDAAAPEATA